MAGKRAVRLNTLGDVRKLLTRVINGLLRDEIDGGKAGKVGYLCNILIAAIEKDDLEGRVKALEAKLFQKWETRNAHMPKEDREAGAAH
jgi:hypothetical protein